MKMEWILGVLLLVSLGGNIVQFITGVKIEANQQQTVSNYNVNQNANINIVNSGVLSGKVNWEIVVMTNITDMTNYLGTLETWQAMNVHVVTLEKQKNEIEKYLLYVPVVESKAKTNVMNVTNTSTNYVKVGLASRDGKSN